MATRSKKATVTDEAKDLGVAPIAVSAPKAASLDDLLSDEVVEAPKTGSTKDVILTGDNVEEAVSNYLQALSDIKDAEAVQADAFAIIAPLAEKARVEISRAQKAYQSTVRINNRLSYGGSSQFCKAKLPADQAKIDGLLTVFGDKYAQYFSMGFSLKVKGEATTPEVVAVLKEACAKVGKKFSDVFGVEKVLVCSKTLHQDRVLLPDVGALLDQAENSGFIKPYKATIKE